VRRGQKNKKQKKPKKKTKKKQKKKKSKHKPKKKKNTQPPIREFFRFGPKGSCEQLVYRLNARRGTKELNSSVAANVDGGPKGNPSGDARRKCPTPACRKSRSKLQKTGKILVGTSRATAIREEEIGPLLARHVRHYESSLYQRALTPPSKSL